jgi:hypothetical protein
MSDWRVRVEVRRPEPPATGEESIDAFLARLADRGATVADGPGRDTYSAQLTVDAASPVHAVARSVEVVRRAAAAAGMAEWPVVHAQVTAAEEPDRPVAAPDPDPQVAALDPEPQVAPDPEPQVAPPDPDRLELVGVSEIATTLGISRRRADTLAHRDDFPEPIARLASGPVWTRPSVERFAESWKRKPGRPSKEDADDAAARMLRQAGKFRRDPNATDAVGPRDAELVMGLIRNARRERLHFDAIEAKVGWERPRLSWVIAELARTYRITYSRDGWASVRRCPRCGGDRITFKEVAVGGRRNRDATIQGLPYCPDCGKDAPAGAPR